MPFRLHPSAGPCRILLAAGGALLAAGCSSGNFCAPASPAVAPPSESYQPVTVAEGLGGTSAPTAASGSGAPTSVTLIPPPSLPTGITLAADGTFSIADTALAGLYTFQVQFRNAGGQGVATAPITVQPEDAFTISYPPDMSGTVNTPFTSPAPQPLNDYTNLPITYQVTSGILPPGMQLASATGIISGTTGTAGPYAFTVTASNGPATHVATTATTITIQ